MSSPFRNDRDAALERAARLEDENLRLRSELEQALRPVAKRRRRRTVALAVFAVAATVPVALHEERPRLDAWLEARRWAHAAEDVRLDWVDDQAGVNVRAAWSGRSGTWAVGDGGAILFRDRNGGWSRQASGTSYDLRAIDAAVTYSVVGDFAAYAVGARGTILRYDPIKREWSPEESGTLADLDAVAVIEWTAFAAGEDGTLLRRDSRGWMPVETGTNATLRALYAPPEVVDPPHTLWVAGDGGTILYYGNLYGRGVAQRTGTGANLYAINGVGGEVVAGGAHGTLLRGSRDGTGAWTTLELAGDYDVVSMTRARETFSMCASETECRFLSWTPTVVAMTSSGELAALDPARGWVLEPQRRGAYSAITAVEPGDRPNGDLLLFEQDGQIARGVPDP